MCFASIVILRKTRIIGAGISFLKDNLSGLVFFIGNFPESKALVKTISFPLMMRQYFGSSKSLAQGWNYTLGS